MLNPRSIRVAVCAVLALLACPAHAAVTFEQAVIASASTADTAGFEYIDNAYQPDFDYAADAHVSQASSLPASLSTSSYAAAVSAAATATAASNDSITFSSATAGRIDFSGTASASMTFDPPPEIGFIGQPYAWGYNGIAFTGDYPSGQPGHYALYRFIIDAPVLLSLSYDVLLSSDQNPEALGLLSYGLNNLDTGFYTGENLTGPGQTNILLLAPGTYHFAIYGGFGQYYNDSAEQRTFGFQNLTYDAFLAFDMQVAAPVPEPGEWAMLIAGLAIVGRMARRSANASA